MAEKECCYTCVYSYLDPEYVMAACFSNFVVGARPSCANHPESLGRMRPVLGNDICPNYRPKPATPEGEVKQIPLGDGYYAYVDAADYEWLNQWTWYLRGGYAVRREKDKVIYMHREIMQPPEGMLVDHKNRNKLDNTRDNLRNATRQENARNHPKRRGSSSRFWGVSYISTRRRYRAAIRYRGELVSCGYFTDEIEAARAHDYKAVELSGEFARLNFPDEWPPERRAEVYAAPEADSARRKTARRKTRDAKRKTKSLRATGHGSRATKKAHAGTRGRRGGRRETRAKAAKPRATKQTKKSSRRTHNARRTTKSKRATAPKRPKRKAT